MTPQQEQKQWTREAGSLQGGMPTGVPPFFAPVVPPHGFGRKTHQAKGTPAKGVTNEYHKGERHEEHQSQPHPPLPPEPQPQSEGEEGQCHRQSEIDEPE